MRGGIEKEAFRGTKETREEIKAAARERGKLWGKEEGRQEHEAVQGTE